MLEVFREAVGQVENTSAAKNMVLPESFDFTLTETCTWPIPNARPENYPLYLWKNERKTHSVVNGPILSWEQPTHALHSQTIPANELGDDISLNLGAHPDESPTCRVRQNAFASKNLIMTSGWTLLTTRTQERSRNDCNYRYVFVLPDLATKWIQGYPCKTRSSQETQRNLQMFLEPDKKPKVITLTIPWNSVKLVKISPGIIARLHLMDQKQVRLLKEQCAK